jgi:hypothetical protein
MGYGEAKPKKTDLPSASERLQGNFFTHKKQKRECFFGEIA